MRIAAAGLALAASCAAAMVPDSTASAVSAGERVYQKCYSCHALEPGKNDLGGPTLNAIAGRRIASEPFEYSPALRAFAIANPAWTRDLLDRFTADPEALVPGTTMLFHGIADPAERALLLDYLERAGDQTKESERSLP